MVVQYIAERLDDLTSLPVMLYALVQAAGILYLRRNNLNNLYNKIAWTISSGAIFFCLTMSSGYMWHLIIKPPFMYSTQNEVEYIYRSPKGQFELETYIVLVLNAGIVFGMILMTEAAQRKGDVRKRTILSFVGLLIVTVFFSLLLSIYRTKSRW